MISVLFVTLSLFFSFFAYAGDKDLIACIDDHPPYQYLGPEPYGSHITALKKLSKVLDRNLTYIQAPNFARCVALLESGHVDVIAGLNITEERKEFAFYAPFKLADKLTIITKKDIAINTYEDFKGKIIGVPRGSTYFFKFDNDDSLNKVSIQNERVGLSLLVKERIDLMMTNPMMLDLHLSEIQRRALRVSPMSLDNERSKETYFGFSKKHNIDLEEEQIKLLISDAFKQGVFLPEPTTAQKLEPHY